MGDMLVRLYALPERPKVAEGVHIKRVLSPDTGRVEEFIRAHFSEGWIYESKAALYQTPPACFIAVKDRKILGFACYDATAKGMFGPVGVDPEARGMGIGGALTYRCMEAMREAGYAYAAIGWPDGKESFYERSVGATVIPDSAPGVYSRMVTI